MFVQSCDTASIKVKALPPLSTMSKKILIRKFPLFTRKECVKARIMESVLQINTVCWCFEQYIFILIKIIRVKEPFGSAFFLALRSGSAFYKDNREKKGLTAFFSELLVLRQKCDPSTITSPAENEIQKNCRGMKLRGQI